MHFKSILLILSLSLFFVGCGSQKRVVSSKKHKGFVVKEPKPTNLPSVKQVEHITKLKTTEKKLNKYSLEYIRKYAPIAVREMHLYKIPASITLAQGLLESNNGRSELAAKSNNHFGIKCHKGWRGERVYHNDDRRGECFRKYTYVETSFEDHSKFLTSRNRYKPLFKLRERDYKAWARGLKRAGYATDRKYPNKLISIIKRYKLYEFDTFKKGRLQYKHNKSTSIKKSDNKYYTVKKGDTLYAIARKFGVSVVTLKELNRLSGNDLDIGQELRLK